jgi:hypothetical protein
VVNDKLLAAAALPCRMMGAKTGMKLLVKEKGKTLMGTERTARLHGTETEDILNRAYVVHQEKSPSRMTV